MHRGNRFGNDSPLLLFGPLDGLHFVPPHPGPLPWGEGESSAVSRSYAGQSLPSQCVLNTRSTAAVPCPRGSTAVELGVVRARRSADFGPPPAVSPGRQGSGLKSALFNSMEI